MLKKYGTEKNYKENVEKLTSLINNDTYKNILLQARSLDSGKHNTTMNTIGKRLEMFYENLRVLEEIRNYAKAYINKEIMTKASEMRELLSELSEIRDFGKNEGFDMIRVDNRLGQGNFIDRDGTIIPRADIYNGAITISSNKISDIDINSVEVEYVESIPYNNNINESIKNKAPYRSFYFLNGPILHGVRERIKLKTSSEVKMNFINTKTSNCEVENIQFIDSNGNIMEDKESPNIKSDRNVKEIIIEIKSDKYEESEYKIDKERASEDFWNKVKDNKLKEYLGEEPLYDLSNYDGLDVLESDYEAYVKEFEKWLLEKKNIKEANDQIRREYEDIVKAYNDEAVRFNREKQRIDEANARVRFTNERREQEYQANLIKIRSYNDLAKQENERRTSEYEATLRYANEKNIQIRESNTLKQEQYLSDLRRIEAQNQSINEQNRRDVENYYKELEEARNANKNIINSNIQNKQDYIDKVGHVISENQRREKENDEIRRLYEAERQKIIEQNRWLEEQNMHTFSAYHGILNGINDIDKSKLDEKWFETKIDNSNYQELLDEIVAIRVGKK